MEDEFHAVHLRLGVPSIFEDGPMIRPWRLALEAPVALENVRGNPSALWVHEVSFKGVLVEIRGRIKTPKTFALWFSPSGYERIALRGTLGAGNRTGSVCLSPGPEATRMRPSACANSSCTSTAWSTRSARLIFRYPGTAEKLLQAPLHQASFIAQAANGRARQIGLGQV